MTNSADTRKEFGAYLGELRAQRNCSVQDVATATQISNPYLYQVESGKKALTNPEYFQRLAHFFGVDTSELLRRAGYLPKNERSKLETAIDLIKKDRAYDLNFLVYSNITLEEKVSVVKLYEKAKGKKLL